MPTIISPADFTVDNNLPNLSLQGNDVQAYIDKYEPKFLDELLGGDMADEFVIGLPQGVVTTATAQHGVLGVGTKFTSMFIVGDTITINAETHTIDTITDDLHLTTSDAWVLSNINATYYGEKRWIDLLNLKSLKLAMIDYIYWFYLKAQAVLTLNTGGGQPKKQNAVTVSLYPKMVAAWNEMVGYNKATNKFLKDNEVTYPEYKPICFPQWFFCFDGFSWFYPGFDSGWYWGFGCHELPEIYRLKNSLGI